MVSFDEAVKRREYHPGSTKTQVYADDYEAKGLRGECDFAERFGIAFDLDIASSRPWGDDGIDFHVTLGTRDGGEREFTVAVRSTGKAPYDLIYRRDEARADLFVLGIYDDDLRSWPRFWTTRERLEQWPRDLVLNNQKCFVMPTASMWPISTFATRYRFGWQHGTEPQPEHVKRIRLAYWARPGDETLIAALNTCEWRRERDVKAQ